MSIDDVRKRKLIEAIAEQFLAVLRSGSVSTSVSTNVSLRRFHNCAVGMHWLPWPVLPRLQWPTVRHKEKRSVTAEEHARIVEREKNPEMNSFLRLLWHLGASQSDVAQLTAESVN